MDPVDADETGGLERLLMMPTNEAVSDFECVDVMLFYYILFFFFYVIK